MGAVIWLLLGMLFCTFSAQAQPITAFPNALTPLTGSEIVPLVQNGKNVKAAVGDVIGSQGAILNAPTINGGTLIGTTVFGQTGTGTVTFTPTINITIPSVPQVLNKITTSASGGNCVCNAQENQVVITGAPTAFWWVGLNQLTYEGTGGGSAQHVAGYNQTLRSAFSAGGAANNPQLWGSVSEMDDFTGQPSAATNATLSYEMDLTGHNVDNADNREMLSGVIAPASDNTNFYEASVGYNLQVATGAYVKKAVNLAGPYTTSLIDFRSGISYAVGTTSGPAPTITAPVSASVTVPVSNIMPFTSDIFGRDINAGSFQVVVHFSDGQSATETGYTITGSGPTPTGTITLSAPITETSGNSVYNSSNAMWLRTGQTIALDTNGATKISSDATTISLTGSVKVSGSTTMPLTTPASSSAACAAGQFAIDANFVYVCAATNTWKRATLSTF